MADRPRVERTNQALQLNGRATPVDTCLVLVQFVGVGGEAVVLHFTFQRPRCQPGNGLDHGGRTHFGQAVVQHAAGVLGADRCADLEQHRPGVQAGFHAHHGHAAFTIARFDGALDRRRTAPAWQQGGVTVDATQARDIQHHLRQDQAIGDHYHQVRLQRRQFCLSLGIA
ncbi:hypothetical protein D3C84_767360 [compost metagenome]